MRGMNTSQLAAWPLTQHGDIGDEELGGILAARLRGREAQLAELEGQLRELAEKIAREREHVAHLRDLLHDLGVIHASPAVDTTITSNGTRPSLRNVANLGSASVTAVAGMGIAHRRRAKC